VSPRRAAWLVARRELRERLRSRAFRVSTLVTLVVVVAVVVISAVAGGGGTTTYEVAITGSLPREIVDEAGAQAPAFDATVKERTVPDAATAARLVRDGDVDAAVVDGQIYARGFESPVVGLLQSAARRVHGSYVLRTANLPERTVQQALAPALLTVRDVGDGDSGGQGVAFVGVLLLYLAILTFGYALAGGVVEEKSSRVVEVVLSAIRPRSLLAGKVVGIGLVGALQVALVVVVGAGLALALGSIDLPDTTVGAALLVALYFVLGYAFYAWAFAVVGAMVSRAEDVQSVSAPLMLLIVAGYLVSFSVIDDAGGTLATVCALLPPVAPMTVPAIAAQGALPLWLLLASIAVMVVSTVVLARIAARVYERSVLRMGSALSWRDVVALAKR
jgi:ABC-2 type transport system permease protein